MKALVLYYLLHLEPSILPHMPTFKAGYNVVHIDEKWFYQTMKSWKIYLTNKNQTRRGKQRTKDIEKIMFLATMARPRSNSTGMHI